MAGGRELTVYGRYGYINLSVLHLYALHTTVQVCLELIYMADIMPSAIHVIVLCGCFDIFHRGYQGLFRPQSLCTPCL